MVLKVLGSSSQGNCYILENRDEALIIEAGVRFIEVKKALGFDIRKVSGCLITHQHNDHAKATSDGHRLSCLTECSSSIPFPLSTEWHMISAQAPTCG